MTLSSIQPLTEMNKKNISLEGGEGVLFLGLIKFLPSLLTILKSERLKILEHLEIVQPCAGFALPLPIPCTVSTSSSRNQIHGLP